MNLSDIQIIEGEVEADELDQAKSLQAAINSGSAWSFQGSYGRAMMEAIESGACMLGKRPARDYWGNYIPSRDQVEEGTKGSYQYVADRMGEAYAEVLAEVA